MATKLAVTSPRENNMSNKGQLLQDPFLNTLRKEHVPVSIYLVNGIKLQGQIESFDQYVVLLRNTVTQMVYKHAISTVVPARPVNLTAEPRRLGGLWWCTGRGAAAGPAAARTTLRMRSRSFDSSRKAPDSRPQVR